MQSPHRPLHRQLYRHVVVGLVTGLALLFGAGTAFAHDVLTASDPANGSSLATGPSKVTLTFDLPVKESFSTITVLGPDGNHYEAGPSTVDGSTVSAPVQPLGPAGGYTVGYRIVSDDGHPVSGSVRFTLTQAGPGHGAPAAESAGSSTGSAEAAAPTPGQPGSPDGSQASDSGSGSGGIPAWPWVVGGVLLVAAGAAIALRLGKGAGD
ncbi:MAG TPA: copper resistance CopC family protein [Pseudonocardia sp.]|nr:copper resistance CopC family protein [Pseudonocardia sp.]